MTCARNALCSRFLERRVELEETLLTRVRAVSVPQGRGSPEHGAGLSRAISAALDCTYETLAHGPEATRVPATLLVQARLAARSGIGLEVVLQRYVNGYTLINDFIAAEAACLAFVGAMEVHQLQREMTSLFNRVFKAITEEHVIEAQRINSISKDAIAQSVRKLLDGESIASERIHYELNAWHLGAIVVGLDMREELVGLAADLDRRVLLVPGGESQTWAWFGGWEKLPASELERHARARLVDDSLMTIGEAAHGVCGWRLSHRQAAVAVPVAETLQRSVVRYADHALLASIAQDDLLARSLRQIYLDPLRDERGGGSSRLISTLRAYYAAGSQVSSAAAALNLSRKTVGNHLSAAEERIGKPLGSCTPDLEAALLLDQAISPQGGR